jgi:hypothetical protein
MPTIRTMQPPGPAMTKRGGARTVRVPRPGAAPAPGRRGAAPRKVQSRPSQGGKLPPRKDAPRRRTAAARPAKPRGARTGSGRKKAKAKR